MFRVSAAGIVNLGSGWTITAAELLRRGDAVMRARWPVLAPTFYVDGYLMRCRFVYPGELTVHCGSTGQLLARSATGNPTRPVTAMRKRRAAPAVS